MGHQFSPKDQYNASTAQAQLGVKAQSHVQSFRVEC